MLNSDFLDGGENLLVLLDLWLSHHADLFNDLLKLLDVRASQLSLEGDHIVA